MKHHRIEIPVKRPRQSKLIRGDALTLHFYKGTCSTQGVTGTGPTPLTAMADLIGKLYITHPRARAGKLVLH